MNAKKPIFFLVYIEERFSQEYQKVECVQNLARNTCREMTILKSYTLNSP